jgi:hypothetical protein
MAQLVERMATMRQKRIADGGNMAALLDGGIQFMAASFPAGAAGEAQLRSLGNRKIQMEQVGYGGSRLREILGREYDLHHTRRGIERLLRSVSHDSMDC